jgi:arginase
VGLIWFDAHADFNTPETSPSGNVHGMPLAASVGVGPERLTKFYGFNPKIKPQNTVLVGVRDIDTQEKALLASSAVRVFTMRDIDERGMRSVVEEAIRIASLQTAGLAVSWDMDFPRSGVCTWSGNACEGRCILSGGASRHGDDCRHESTGIVRIGRSQSGP